MKQDSNDRKFREIPDINGCEIDSQQTDVEIEKQYNSNEEISRFDYSSMEVIQEIGMGTTSIVFLVQFKSEPLQKLYALKTMQKQ